MIAIKPITHLHQLQKVEELATQIWHEHYTPIIGKAQVEYMLKRFQSVAAMQKQIDEGYEYYSVIANNELVGYLSIQPKEELLFLSKAYIHSPYRGKGYGQRALDFVTQRATELSLCKVQLTVNKYNTRAVAVYEKYGFKKIREAVFDIGQGYIMDDFVMEKDVV